MVDRRDGVQDDDGRERALWLSELLDAAADVYEPDTERLTGLVSARIAQQAETKAEAEAEKGAKTRTRTRTPRRRRGLGLIGRLGLAGIPAGVALSTIGAAAAIAVGATATIAVTSSHGHHTVAVAGPSTSTSPGTVTSDTAGSASPSAGTGESASSAATGESTHPATPSLGAATTGSSSSGLVGASASVDQASNAGWSQLDLAVTVKEPLTALHVTVKVSKCAGLASTGSFDTVGSQFTEVTTTGSDGSITYEFELVKGATLAPGTFTFAAQFQHVTSGWKQQDDTYYVSARMATSTSASVASGAY